MFNSYIVTYTGKKFYPLDPQPDAIDIVDIAHALSNTCRFTGHTRDFYSVAQHSMYVAQLMPVGYMLEGLLHDASEAYLTDIATPIKPLLNNYRSLEKGIMKAIQEKFHLANFWHETFKKADAIMLRTEIRDLMGYVEEYGVLETPIEEHIYPMSPHYAKRAFLKMFYDLERSKE